MLINLSNHPSDNWDKRQKETALNLYENIIDIKFPEIDSHFDSHNVEILAKQYCKKVSNMLNKIENNNEKKAVHIQGEFTFVFKLVKMLKQAGIKCIASTSRRNVEINDNGDKIVKFDFVRFRDY